MTAAGDIRWFDPIKLQFDKEVSDKRAVHRLLVRAMREGLREQGFESSDIKRAVYVIRITGSFLIAYEKYDSPVLYIGRGNAFGRLASHIRRWARDVKDYGQDAGLEIRCMLPRRKKRSDYYKNVEADLIALFVRKTGDLPFFNKCRETKFEGKIEYGATQLRTFRAHIGVGSGKRFKWALRPTPANPDYRTYWTSSCD